MTDQKIKELNNKCEFIVTYFWEYILLAVKKNVSLLDESDPANFIKATWNELVNTYPMIANTDDGHIQFLYDYKKNYDENPEYYDGLSWDDVLDSLNSLFEIKYLNDECVEEKCMFFYDIFNILGLEEFAQMMNDADYNIYQKLM